MTIGVNTAGRKGARICVLYLGAEGEVEVAVAGAEVAVAGAEVAVAGAEAEGDAGAEPEAVGFCPPVYNSNKKCITTRHKT